jgi:hypothetical protein
MTTKVEAVLVTRVTLILLAFFLVISTTEAVLAHGGGGDIAVYTNPGDPQVHVGFAVLDDMDINHIFFDPHDKVHQAILIPRTPSLLPPIPYAIGSTEPGFDADEMELPTVKPLTVNTLDLSYWDGNGDVNFGPATGVNGGYAPQPNTTFADGGYHAHATFGLCDDSVANCADAPVPDGVYLAKLNVSVQGLQDSEPYYLVALVDQTLYTGDEDQNAENAEMVGEMVREYLADPSGPEPMFGGRNYAFYADAIAHAESLVIPEPSALILVFTLLTTVLVVRWRE